VGCLGQECDNGELVPIPELPPPKILQDHPQTQYLGEEAETKVAKEMTLWKPLDEECSWKNGTLKRGWEFGKWKMARV
jgi:hypothetical protein